MVSHLHNLLYNIIHVIVDVSYFDLHGLDSQLIGLTLLTILSSYIISYDESLIIEGYRMRPHVVNTNTCSACVWSRCK